jgi:hypothetical protein
MLNRKHVWCYNLEFIDKHMKLKQAIIVRTDLGMGKGKIAGLVVCQASSLRFPSLLPSRKKTDRVHPESFFPRLIQCRGLPFY